MSEPETLAERLAAVERAVTDGETDVAALREAADLDDRLGALADRLAAAERRLDDLEAASQAVRGYVGDVRAVNELATMTKRVAGHVTESLIEAGANRTVGEAYDRWAGRHLVSVPPGLPLAPVPGFWYVTANA